MGMRTSVVGKSRGYSTFSLLEVIVVLVILSTVFALMIPKIGHVAGGVRRSALLGTINSAFHMASSIALATGKPARLVFNFSEGTMSVKRSDTNNQGTEPPDEDMDLNRESIFKDVEQFLLPEGTAPDPLMDDETVEYRFFQNGEAAGSEVSLLITERQRISIDVDRLTGRPLVSVYEE